MTEDSELRSNIIDAMDSFIEKIQKQRAIMLGVSISALILAPFAIGISAYLITHPSFLLVVENEGEFGFMLIVLLVGIIIVSGLWLATGMRQYNSLSHWNERYCNYLKKKEQLDNSISEQYQLDEDQS